MNRRSFPLWLLRDLPALIGLALSFWPLMILVITNGRKAMRGQKIDPAIYEALMEMLPVAEARLRYALYRQAWRAFGWNPRMILLEDLPPITTWSEFGPRFEAYRLAMSDLREAASVLTDILRDQYRIRANVDANTVRAAHGSTVALRAAHHEAEGFAASSSRRSSIALMVSSARSARPSNHEGVLANARGPPPFPDLKQSTHPYLSAPTRLRPPPRAHFPTAQRSLGSRDHGDLHAYPPRAACHDSHRRLRHRLGRRATDRLACAAAQNHSRNAARRECVVLCRGPGHRQHRS